MRQVRDHFRSRAAMSLLALVVPAVGLTGCSTPGTILDGETTITPAPPPATTGGAAGPQNTGPPPDNTLDVTNSLTISEAGTVVEGLDIYGCVVIAASDVTLRDSRVRCQDPNVKRAITAAGDVSGTVIEGVEIDGGGVVDIGVDLSDARLTRLDVHGFNDGVRMGDSVVLEDSWIHDLSRSGELHPDAVQGISSHDVVIRGNTLDPRSADGSDLGNAAIMLGSETDPFTSSNVLIEDNYMDGGNYSLNIRGDIDAEGFVIRDNVFGDGSRYGPVICPSSIPVDGDNTMEDSGVAVEVDRP